MNLRLPGRGAGDSFFPLLSIALTALFILLPSVASAQQAEGKTEYSGVVKPKITTLQKFTVSQSPTIEEFRLPKKYSSPVAVVADSENRIWFTEAAANLLAVLNPKTLELKEYRIPSTSELPNVDWDYDPRAGKPPEKLVQNFSVGQPGNMAIAPNGAIWFVLQYGNSVVRFEPDKEKFTELIVPTENARPYDVAVDSKGDVWFIEKNAGKLGYINVAKKKITEYSLGPSAGPMGIAVDAKDNVWIGDVNGNYIGKFDPQKKTLKRFDIMIRLAQPGQMRFDKNGMLWFCQVHAKQLGVLLPGMPNPSVAEMPGFNATPQALAPADDGLIWFVDSMMNRIGYFDSTNIDWNIFEIPTSNAQPMGMAIDANGDIWFTESGRRANSIAKLVRATVPKKESAAGAGEDEQKMQSGVFDTEVEESGSAMFLVGGAVALIIIVVGFVLIRRKRSKT